MIDPHQLQGFPSPEVLFPGPRLGVSCDLRGLWCADWIQHVLDTEGEPYLQTPEDDIPILSLLLVDVLGFLLVASALPALAAWAGWKHLRRRTAKPRGKSE